MRMLFDHNTPLPLRYSLIGHEVATTAERGWERLTNGKLLEAAEAAAFKLLLTADKGFHINSWKLARRKGEHRSDH